MMFIKLTSKRQATFPARVLEALGARPGDRLALIETGDGFLLRTERIDHSRLAPLRDKLRRGQGRFDLDSFRREPHDPALRD